jgi:hypothetical protein
LTPLWTSADDAGRPVALVVAETTDSLGCVHPGFPDASPLPMPLYERDWDVRDEDMAGDPEEADAHRRRWRSVWWAVLATAVPGLGRADDHALELYLAWLDLDGEDLDLDLDEDDEDADPGWDRWLADGDRLAALEPPDLDRLTPFDPELDPELAREWDMFDERSGGGMARAS